MKEKKTYLTTNETSKRKCDSISICSQNQGEFIKTKMI